MKSKHLADTEVARQARPGESWELARYRLERSPWPRQMRPCVNNRGTGEVGDCWNLGSLRLQIGDLEIG